MRHFYWVPIACVFVEVEEGDRGSPVSILYKSIAGRYRPVRVADGPIMARYWFIKNASWVHSYCPGLTCCFSQGEKSFPFHTFFIDISSTCTQESLIKVLHIVYQVISLLARLRWAIVISQCSSSVVRHQQSAWNDYSSDTSWPNDLKLGRKYRDDL